MVPWAAPAAESAAATTTPVWTMDRIFRGSSSQFPPGVAATERKPRVHVERRYRPRPGLQAKHAGSTPILGEDARFSFSCRRGWPGLASFAQRRSEFGSEAAPQGVLAGGAGVDKLEKIVGAAGLGPDPGHPEAAAGLAGGPGSRN